jgi:hypothetical protein
MGRWKKWVRQGASEEGSSSLEFITAGVLLLVPIVYLVIAIGVIQGATLATEGAARQAARVFVDAGTAPTAQSRAQTAVAFALKDYGIDMNQSQFTISCRTPSNCLTPGSPVAVTVTTRVSLPGVPAMMGLDQILNVPITSQTTMLVSRFPKAGA